MDVSFTNILEGARQYFQGLPASTDTATGPKFSSTENHHAAKYSEPSIQNIAKVEYSPTRHDLSSTSREHTPYQKYTSRHSDSFPPSHHSQVRGSPSNSSSHLLHQEQVRNHSYKFSHRQSQEIPFNTFQQQNYQPYKVQSSAYIHSSSPQQLRTPPSLGNHNMITESSQQYPALLQPQHNIVSCPSYPLPPTLQSCQKSLHSYQNYDQNKSYLHSKGKIQLTSTDVSQNTAASYTDEVAAQDNAYCKMNDAYNSHSTSTTCSPSQLDTSLTYCHPYVNHSFQGTHADLLQTDASSKRYSISQNLSSTSSQSSVNYQPHWDSRDSQILNTTFGRQAFVPANSNSSTSTENVELRTTSSASKLEQGIKQMSDSFLTFDSQIGCNNLPTYSSHTHSQNFCATVTTNSCSRAVMTSSSVSSYSTPTLQSSSKSSYYQSNKTHSTIHRAQPVRLQIPLLHQQTIHNKMTHADLTSSAFNGDPKLQVKHQRESPLDLSVKTIKTSADSTHEDTGRSICLKESRQGYQAVSASICSNIVPLQRSQNQSPAQAAVVTAPKVDFSPDFSLHSNRCVTTNEFGQVVIPSSTEKAPTTQRLQFEDLTKHRLNQCYPDVSRYPISMLTKPHINTYTENVRSESLPHRDFSGHIHTTPAVYSVSTPDLQRKRTADTALSVTPPKIVKVDDWKKSMDQQVEHQFSTHKQQQKQNEFAAVTGYTHQSNEKRENNLFQRANQLNDLYLAQTNTHYYQTDSDFSQEFKPSVSECSNSNFMKDMSHKHQQQKIHHQFSGSNYSSSSNIVGTKSVKNNVGSAANKHVLSLLRNSLEIKSVKEAQKKMEKMCNIHEHQTSTPGIQQSSIHVTAPLQPKPDLNGGQSISPLMCTILPESNYSVTPHKIHNPQAVSSVQFKTEEMEMHDGFDAPYRSNCNSDLDGLATFLIARIRTKAELKQAGPTLLYNSANVTNNDTKYTSNDNIHLHDTKLNIVKPIKEENVIQETTTNSTCSDRIIPPKLVERQLDSPLCKPISGDENNPIEKSPKVPPRNKSGVRSSSETSVFDFPGSPSDEEMPILERQSLEDMRKDRKLSIKESVSKEIKFEDSKGSSCCDDVFDKACNSFIQQLNINAGKKRVRRKIGMNVEVLTVLKETVTEEKPVNEVKIKVEIKDCKNNIKSETSDIETDETESRTLENCGSYAQNIFKYNTLFNNRVVSKNEMQSRKSYKKLDKDSSDDESKNALETDYKSSSNEYNELLKKNKGSFNKNGTNKSTVHDRQAEVPLIIKPVKKPTFGDGSDFYPGWEEEVCRYKKSLRMPPSLIHITRPPRCHRLSTSLPDLDPCSYSAIDNGEFFKNKIINIKLEPVDSDTESNASFSLFGSKNNYDSEGSSSVISLPNTSKESTSILDKLYERYGGYKRRKHKKKDDKLKIILKSDSDLLPTPNLEIQTADDKDSKASEPIVTSKSALLGFRKKTIKAFKETFIKAEKMIGVNEHLMNLILNSHNRKQIKVLKKRATIKEIFGEDRPASAPPDTCVSEAKIEDTKIKEIQESNDNNKFKNKYLFSRNRSAKLDTKLVLKDILLSKDEKWSENLSDASVDQKIQTEFKKDSKGVSVDDAVVIKHLDMKSKASFLDENKSNFNRRKLKNIRRKGSSGFDYIRKKKKHNKRDNIEGDITVKPKRTSFSKSHPESIQDIQKEIRMWVLNKGVGETLIHRAARLGYVDVVAYCLEKLNYSPSVRDNAGVTPLHVACMKGHLDIVRLLLTYGANPIVQASGGMRPLHEAAENGFVEIVRLLLSYGADPMLRVYTGKTPLELASDRTTIEFLEAHLSDICGDPVRPWFICGPSLCFDPKDTGYSLFDDVPENNPSLEEDENDVEFEVSDTVLPNLYTLKNESPNDRWLLLQDLSNLLKIKSRDALLRQIYLPAQSSSLSSSVVNHKSVVRELKMSDFLEQAHCCQFLNAGEKINTRASKIALLKYTDKVKELLNVEKVVISLR